jgi:hypothetical protein
MKFRIKESTLTDGSKVQDLNLVPNGMEEFTKRPICIFSCSSKKDAELFFAGLSDLIEKHTVETLEEM